MTARRIELLMDELGADIAVSIREHVPYTPKQLMMKRTTVELVYDDLGSEAIEWADGASKATVVWDRHTRWSAHHRQFLRRCLLGAGVDDADVTHIWAWPYDQGSPPLENHVALMRPLTLQAIDAANSRYVLLVGLTSLKMWRRELVMHQVEGHSGVWNRQWIVFPVANPISVMRDPYLQGQWRQQIYTFGQMVNEGQEFEQLNRRCAAGTVKKRCDQGVMMYDVDGVGWCTKHYGKGIKRRTDHQSKTLLKMNTEQQERML